MNVNKTLLVLFVVAVPLLAYFFTHGENPIIQLPGGMNSQLPLVLFSEQVPLRVEVVKTAEDLARGLSGRRELGPTTGMLFVFPRADYHGIWMKDMLIPIDIIWINEKFRVIHIEKNVLPDTYPKVFEPSEHARFVIETNGNYADSFKIRVGDKVTIPANIIPSDLR